MCILYAAGFTKLCLLIIAQTRAYKPEISATLKLGKIKLSTQDWLADTAESFALMGAFLAIVHPPLYQAGHEVFHRLTADPSIMKEGDAALEVLQY